MIDLIAASTQYSNIVMVALLPQVSHFAAALGLSNDVPISLSSVARFTDLPDCQNPQAGFQLTNGDGFFYNNGHVEMFISTHSFFDLQRIEDMPKFYGEFKMTTNSAIAMARKALQSLGYNLHEIYADLPPEITSPDKVKGHVIPVFDVVWHSPLETLPNSSAIEMEINGQTRRIETVKLTDPCFSRSPVQISGILNGDDIYDPFPPLTREASNSLANIALSKVPAFISTLGLPISSSIHPRDVLEMHVWSDNYVQIILTNYYRFWYGGGRIHSFAARDAVFTSNTRIAPLPIEKYLGEWKIGDSSAAEIVRRSIVKLGYSTQVLGLEGKPSVLRPRHVGNYLVPRLFLKWRDEVLAEIDARNGEIKFLQVP